MIAAIRRNPILWGFALSLAVSQIAVMVTL